ncbi:MAG: energy transducer TonB, partial [Longimicrobiales bacterium]|nr:energy transducer TonB [Longimicrobiales bacterium]
SYPSESSGHPALDDAALNVAGAYEFSPARNGDEDVPVWVQFPITFRSDGGDEGPRDRPEAN